MKKLSKTFSAFVAFVLLISSLAGCGGTADISGDDTQRTVAGAETSVSNYDSGEQNGVYYHTFSDSAPYLSGKIVIGDSRCCQLGEYQQSAGECDFAAFAFWGGHYIPGYAPQIITDDSFEEVRKCFEEQIKTRGRCTLFFFATINDYDHTDSENDESVSYAVAAAEKLASMECEIDGRTYRPDIVVIGFAGVKDGVNFSDGLTSEVFNEHVDDCNEKLNLAVSSSEVLKDALAGYTTVKDITNGSVTFVDDAVHYGDETLEDICEYIADFN
ncbi:MAG: hypothetical protein IKN38_04200 [Clostridia bacterium]|nr:hypothetical protein [Clostridia bacterium]